MAISSQNAILNQWAPPFCIKDPIANQTLLYDSVTRTFRNKTITAADIGFIAPDGLLWENAYSPGDVVVISDDLLTFKAVPASLFGGGSGGATRLNDLIDVAIVDPISDKSVLVYNSSTMVWEDTFVSYLNLTNVPTTFTPSVHTHVEADITNLDKYTQAQVNTLLNGKVNIIAGGTVGNFVTIGAGNTITNSGLSSASFATATQGAKADTALQPASSINALADVDTTGATVGQVLKWNGTNWVPETDNNTDLVTSVFTRTGAIVATAGDYTASQITFVNTTSGLTAITVQDAIDELDSRTDTIETTVTNLSLDSHTHSNKAVIDLITNAGSGQIITLTERALVSSAIQPSDNITTLTNNAGYISGITAESIGDLSDVNIAGITADDILVWDTGTSSFVLAKHNFLTLIDTPTSFAGSGTYMVSVNAAETGLEFTNVIDGGTF